MLARCVSINLNYHQLANYLLFYPQKLKPTAQQAAGSANGKSPLEILTQGRQIMKILMILMMMFLMILMMTTTAGSRAANDDYDDDDDGLDDLDDDDFCRQQGPQTEILTLGQQMLRQQFSMQ